MQVCVWESHMLRDCSAADWVRREGGQLMKRLWARPISSSYGRSWGIWDSRWWTLAISHSVLFTSFCLYNTIWQERERETAVSEALQSQRQTSRPQFLHWRVLHTKIWQFNLIDRFYATISYAYDVKIFFSKEKKVTKVYLEELAETVFPVN